MEFRYLQDLAYLIHHGAASQSMNQGAQCWEKNKHTVHAEYRSGSECYQVPSLSTGEISCSNTNCQHNYVQHEIEGEPDCTGGIIGE